MMRFTRRQSFWLPAIPLILSNGLARAVELDPTAVIYKLPDQIQWGPPSPAGARNAVLTGDPAKEGLYAVMTKWLAGNHFSHPHFHPHDRFITVLKGTWWGCNGADARGQLRHPFRQAGAFRRRQDRGCRPAHCRRGAGNRDASRGQIGRRAQHVHCSSTKAGGNSAKVFCKTAGRFAATQCFNKSRIQQDAGGRP